MKKRRAKRVVEGRKRRNMNLRSSEILWDRSWEVSAIIAIIIIIIIIIMVILIIVITAYVVDYG